MGSAVDLSLESFDLSQNFIEGGHVTDDHFPHARIVFSKLSGETVVRCQAKRARFGTFVVRFGRFEKDRFMMRHACQQIETLERAILGLVPNQLRHIVVVARHSIRERLGGILMDPLDTLRPRPGDDEIDSPAEMAGGNDAKGPVRRFSLAIRSEAIFSRGSPLDLPASVFAGAVALGFFSYLTGVHNVTYGRVDGLTKQVGFLWAPNWTFLFMVFMPLFFAFVVELVAFWINPIW